MHPAEVLNAADILRRHPDAFSGGVRLIPVQTAYGTFNVWTKRSGDNPGIKLLLLYGGPGATHEYFEAFESYLPQAGVEYYYYDQLGSDRSSQPDMPELWETARFVEEVEQVRQALNLDAGNFFLLGQSWGGILAIEYALKYQHQRAGRRRQTGAMGPYGRAAEDPCAHANHRRGARHHGPEAHGGDGARAAEGTLPALSRRQPHGDVRRSSGVHGRAARFPARGGSRGRLTRWAFPILGSLAPATSRVRSKAMN